MTSVTHKEGDTRACCLDPYNLVRSSPRQDVTLDTCRVCGARHFNAYIDPAKLFGKGATLGK